jgi:hypothetical protein
MMSLQRYLGRKKKLEIRNNMNSMQKPAENREMEPNPSKYRAIHMGDDPSF